MRVTAKAKARTRAQILETARNLFQKKGFEKTTTRDIAAQVGIAAGTLFNYFPTKEALAMAIVGGCLEAAKAEFQERLRDDEALDERLFAHVAISLRHLRSHRGYIGDVLESTLSPFAQSAAAEAGEQMRRRHLETVTELLGANGSTNGREPSLVTLHLYWTLFVGVLAYWAGDQSPNQEDTLVLLDQSMKLFVSSLSNDLSRPMEVADGTAHR